jgi:2-oxoglutarate ferredoxin oxidoreductase subunit gamma
VSAPGRSEALGPERAARRQSSTVAPGRREIRIAGTGGQGLLLAGRMLAEALVAEGRRVAQSQTYEPTSRGGYCNADLVVSDREVDYPLATSLDALVLLDRLAVAPSWPHLRSGALVLADTRLCPELPPGDCRVLHLPLTRTAIELGSERVANIVALAALAALADLCDHEALARAVRAETPRSFITLNTDALAAGRRLAEQATAGA